MKLTTFNGISVPQKSISRKSKNKIKKNEITAAEVDNSIFDKFSKFNKI